MSKESTQLIFSIIIGIAMFGLFKNWFISAGDTGLKEVVKNGAFLVDVRTPGEFKGGSVKGAVNIPLGSIRNNLSKLKGKKNIVVFCRSGSRSSQAKAFWNKTASEM